EAAIVHSNKYDGFRVIPGIEFSCVFNDEEVHILGYFIDYKDKDLIKITGDLKNSRLTRRMEMVNRINELGLEISLEEVKELSGEEYIGRPHIARALVKIGYVDDVAEAFTKYL